MLCSSKFKYNSIEHTEFIRSDLSYVIFESCQFFNCKLVKCELFETEFYNCSFNNVIFSDCLFSKSIINDCLFNNINIMYSWFDELILKNINIKNIIGVDTATIKSININNKLIYGQDAISYINNNYISN